MPALLLDTSSSDLFLGLVDQHGRLLSQEFPGEMKQQSGHLFVRLEEFLNHHQTSIEEISAIILGEGPGSYTGLRVGVSLAKIWCHAKCIPCYSFDSRMRKELKAIDWARLKRIDDLIGFEPVYENDRYEGNRA